MEKDITVAMTREEYEDYKKAEEIIKKLTGKVQELQESKKIDITFTIVEKHFLENFRSGEFEEVPIERQRVKSQLDMHEDIPQFVKNSLQSTEFIAKEFQDMYIQLSRIPNWVTKLFNRIYK